MELDYASLLSPYPLYFPKMGHVKPLTLREIWQPEVTCRTYNWYLSLMHMTPQIYYRQVDPQKAGCGDNLSMFDLISSDQGLREQYCSALNLFLEETVSWNEHYQAFFTYTEKDEDGSIIPFGIIHRGIFDELCQVILQLNGINSSETMFDESKAKNKHALKILQKIKKGQEAQKKKGDSRMELPNMISALSCRHSSINLTNIWDLTVFQLYDQFQRQQMNTVYDIKCMSLAAWGDKNNKFDYTEWFKNLK